MVKDELFDKAVKIVFAAEHGSVSQLQRRLEIGYCRAARIIDQMKAVGIIGDFNSEGVRALLVTPQEYERDNAIRRLWLAYRDLSDELPCEEWTEADLALWGQVTAHKAVQSRLEGEDRNTTNLAAGA